MRNILRLAAESDVAIEIDRHDHVGHAEAVDGLLAAINSDDEQVGELIDLQDGVAEGRLVLEELGLDLSSLIARLISWLKGGDGKSSLKEKAEASNKITDGEFERTVKEFEKGLSEYRKGVAKDIQEMENNKSNSEYMSKWLDSLPALEKAWVYSSDTPGISPVHEYYGEIDRAQALHGGKLEKILDEMEKGLRDSTNEMRANIAVRSGEAIANLAGLISEDSLDRPLPFYDNGSLKDCFAYLQKQAIFLKNKNFVIDLDYLNRMTHRLETWQKEIEHIKFDTTDIKERNLLKIRSAQIQQVTDYIMLVNSVADVTLAFKKVYKKTLLVLKDLSTSNGTDPDLIGKVNAAISELKD